MFSLTYNFTDVKRDYSDLSDYSKMNGIYKRKKYITKQDLIDHGISPKLLEAVREVEAALKIFNRKWTIYQKMEQDIKQQGNVVYSN